MIPKLQLSVQRPLGIMTTRADDDPPFGDRDFFRRLCLAGRRAGLTVYVFTPQAVDWTLLRVSGYAYETEEGRWVQRSFPPPTLVYDRCFCSTRREYAEYREALQRSARIGPHAASQPRPEGQSRSAAPPRAGPRFAPYLPRTEVLRGMHTLAAWLRHRREAVLKPQGGSQGRGVLLLRRSGGPGGEAAGGRVPGPGTVKAAEAAFTVRGRDARNRPVARGFADAGALMRWLRGFVAQRPYLLQEYLQLQSKSGSAYDVRALVQKDGTGRWRLTGMAVRQGQGGDLTSNLHGGGSALPAADFLAREFGEGKAEALLRELKRLSELLPEALESSHGRLAELGIDYGIDTSGNIWIIEVNSKPGRSIFTYLQDDRARKAAIVNPIRYAGFLLRRMTPAGTGSAQRMIRDR
ncbi:YheC/YheD family protein [Paenibacillus sp. P26]|nr:YheC/YheD family protein [Paenibacillus sp. P26]